MRILITGGRGMLGHALTERLGSRHDVVVHDLEEMDVRDWTAVWEGVRAVRPEIVIHAAAYTQVDDCESNRDDAFAVNTFGAGHVAVACRRLGVPVVFPSTDYVFDGEKGAPYEEFDIPRPVSVYGWSKLMGEEWVRRHQPDHWIVRAAWFFGPGGKNFVRTIVERGRERAALRVVDDQVGSPTYTVDLAVALADLVDSMPFGTYHLTNSGECSWFDLAVAALRAAGVESEPARIDTEASGRPARRPRYSVLRNRCWELSGRAPLRDWREAVSEYVSNSLR